MARRGIPKGQVNWYLREWMDHLSVKQTEMSKRTGWSKASASQLYNGVQDYSPNVVNEAAKALNVAGYELLMIPERAMALRRLRETALQIVHAESTDEQLTG
jgi:transcriptional regulator with XRE-family HTH domain